MAGFFGLSHRVGRARIGIGRGGPWAKLGGGRDDAYVGVMERPESGSGEGSAQPPRRPRALPQRAAEMAPAVFQVYEHGRITVTLGGLTEEVTREQLRAVLAHADAEAGR